MTSSSSCTAGPGTVSEEIRFAIGLFRKIERIFSKMRMPIWRSCSVA